MAGQDDISRGLPDLLRDSNRPIIIYQPPANLAEEQTRSALGLIAWLALFTVCIVVAALCFWTVWNPGSDPRQESLVYSAGRPLGLSRQIEERTAINEQTAGLFEFLDRVRADNQAGLRTTAIAPPVLTDRDGIDDLRRDWNAMCLSVRQRIFDRRTGRFDTQIAGLRQQRAQSRDAGEMARIDAQLAGLSQARAEELTRLNADPALRCVPAEQAPACSDYSSDLWCNPELSRAGEFLEEAGDDGL